MTWKKQEPTNGAKDARAKWGDKRDKQGAEWGKRPRAKQTRSRWSRRDNFRERDHRTNTCKCSGEKEITVHTDMRNTKTGRRHTKRRGGRPQVVTTPPIKSFTGCGGGEGVAGMIRQPGPPSRRHGPTPLMMQEGDAARRHKHAHACTVSFFFFFLNRRVSQTIGPRPDDAADRYRS